MNHGDSGNTEVLHRGEESQFTAGGVGVRPGDRVAWELGHRSGPPLPVGVPAAVGTPTPCPHPGTGQSPHRPPCSRSHKGGDTRRQTRKRFHREQAGNATEGTAPAGDGRPANPAGSTRLPTMIRVHTHRKEGGSLYTDTPIRRLYTQSNPSVFYLRVLCASVVDLSSPARCLRGDLCLSVVRIRAGWGRRRQGETRAR